MLRLYVPVAVTVVLIGALTAWEGKLSDRFVGSSVTAEEFGKRFALVPKSVGAWEGEDRPVDAKTLEVAGAVNHVSRVYTNTETGAQVDLWLVVGHSRDISRHTPDVCYQSQGFSQDGSMQKHRVEVEGEEPATFHTARFRREDMAGVPTRVFWAWNANQEPEHQAWEAPDNARLHYGNNTALYKMYFTAKMNERDELASDNVAAQFAEVMLPVVNRALFPELYKGHALATAEQAAAAVPSGAMATADDAALEEVADEAEPSDRDAEAETPDTIEQPAP
jgi:hypothetical protein